MNYSEGADSPSSSRAEHLYLKAICCRLEISKHRRLCKIKKMSLSHVLFLAVALSGAVYAIHERGVASNLNMDLESGQLLLSTRAGDGEVKVVVM